MGKQQLLPTPPGALARRDNFLTDIDRGHPLVGDLHGPF